MIKPEPMGIITHNWIYACIDASPCLVIVDPVIIEVLTLSFTLLRRRRFPWAGGGAACCRRQPPCQGAATPVAGAAAPAGGSPLQVCHGQPLAGWPLATVPYGHAVGSHPFVLAVPAGGRPLWTIAPTSGRPLQVVDSTLVGGPWLQPVTPTGGVGPSQPPPCRGPWPQPTAPCSQEIVYPCIPDPDGGDEGGQASSSLAVSTRWISTAKLLQSGLATLAQRERGE
ncbi:hypothetical protein BHE74_00054313 [Ensete ventricosum]|nr:hypothetical protein BHE74_00054313 [Ensete ventricosum]